LNGGITVFSDDPQPRMDKTIWQIGPINNGFRTVVARVKALLEAKEQGRNNPAIR
jgi:hypothetical protein